MSETPENIESLRREIDACDGEILQLINRRLAVALKIGALKKQQGTGVVDPDRERNLIRRLISLNKGPLSNANLYHLFQEIITISRAIQQPQLSSGLGPGSTRVHAVIGNPVAHSLSPLMHNEAFTRLGYDGVYVACRVEDIAAAAAGIRALNVQGVSVTIPHKVAVMAHLDEIDAQARRIGAVNTIVNRNGSLRGYTTDAPGAVKALKQKTTVSAKRVFILGAGGAARAIGHGVVDEGGNVVIVNRSRDRGEALARELNGEFQPLSELHRIDGEILINTTPLGMLPNYDEIPIDPQILQPELVVMDIVYNPPETRLLKEAAAIGCTVIDGVAMFVFQGALQLELWTGETAPVEAMQQVVEAALQRL